MASLIETLRETLTTNNTLQRTNRFLVSILGAPVDLLKDGRESYLVKEAKIPNRTVSPISLSWFGVQTQIPGDMTFDDLSITFYNETKFDLRDAFINWMKLCSDYTAGSRGGLDKVKLAPVSSGIKVQMFKEGDVDEGTGASYLYEGCYPKSVGEIALSYSEENSVETFEVSFAVDYWTSVGVE